MSIDTTSAEPFDPADHTVTEVIDYLGLDKEDGVDDAEVTRVYEAEREGKARSTLLEAIDAATIAVPDEPEQAGVPADERPGTPSTTRGASFAEAAEAATPADQGYIGSSPERERTGLADKGLSQATPAILSGGPIPDPRRGVDDSAAFANEG